MTDRSSAERSKAEAYGMTDSEQLVANPQQLVQLSNLTTGVSVVLAAAIAWFALRNETTTWTYEYYDNRALEGDAIVGELATADIDSDTNFLTGILNNDYFSMRLKSCVRVPVAGRYQFRLSADNGARLYLNNDIVVDAWKDGLPATGKDLNLAPGNYPLTIEYYDSGGPARMRAEISQAGVHTFRSLRGRTEHRLSDGGCDAI